LSSPALDGCPGILALHPARDGQVARIRLPGGYVGRRQWGALAALAREFGDGRLDLTARGNVQLRGVREEAAAALALRAARAGLLPSGAHDRARNITASPLSGLGGRAALRRLVSALDAALIAEPGCAALPGRFLIAADDGSGGASLAGSDIGLRRAGDSFHLIIAGRLTGVRVPADAAVTVTIAAVHAALAGGVGGAATRVAGLADGGEQVAAAIGGSLGKSAPDRSARLPLGMTDDTALVVAAPLGRLTAAQAELTGSLLRARETIRLAAAGRLVIPLAAAPASALATLAAAGMVTSDDHPLAGVTACSGTACSRAAADVRTAARPVPGRPRTHWAGCARRCGCPPDADPVTAVGRDRYLLPGSAEPVPLAMLLGPG
jgi:precorrin-3B synthase